jgi:hypothetical protein
VDGYEESVQKMVRKEVLFRQQRVRAWLLSLVVVRHVVVVSVRRPTSRLCSACLRSRVVTRGAMQERLEALLSYRRAQNRVKEEELQDFMDKRRRADDYRCVQRPCFLV